MPSDSFNKNYYEILEIDSDASPEIVRDGYIRAKNAYSQESLALYSLMSKEECQRILDQIEEAYTIVSDPHKRKLYDEARGIKKRHSFEQAHESSISRSMTENSHSENISDDQKPAVSKLVAKRKFSLDYSVNDQFEKEIESATDFDGEFLRRIREYKNVDIPRMSEMTKISKTYLKNIEEENLDNLPATVYTRGFVYQYAKCLKLNPEIVANSYMSLVKEKKNSPV